MKKSFSASRTPAIAAIFGLSMLLAPSAHADPDVGNVIAAQGNHALEVIKADLKQSIRSWQPAFGQIRKSRSAAIRTRTQTADGASATGTARCAP